MLLHLVKKDLLISKRYVIIMLLLTFALPVFILLLEPSVPGVLPFIYAVIFGEVLLLQAIAPEEEKHPKAVALLCAGPYKRETFVLATLSQRAGRQQKVQECRGQAKAPLIFSCFY